MTLDVSVIIPTFREGENLPVLLPKIIAVFNDSSLNGEIIIVDDNSDDETASVCEEFAKKHPVHLLIRKNERGLSSAVVHGLSHAKGDVFLVMDADLSHPPERIPDLINAIKKSTNDFVIGSRYVPGAGTDDDWGVFRWINSKVATLLARPLTTARDPMAGFFAIRRETLQSAAHLDPIGYKIGLELMVKCGCKSVYEVPIHFSDRMHGESKLNLQQQFEYIKHLKRLYEYRLGRLGVPIQFVMVGATGLVVDLLALTVILQFVPFQTARAIAIWVAMTWNFWLNRRLTFSYAREHKPIPQYVMYCLSCLIGGAINWGVSLTLHNNISFFSERLLISAICGIVAGTGVNFFLNKRFTFRTSVTKPARGRMLS